MPFLLCRKKKDLYKNIYIDGRVQIYNDDIEMICVELFVVVSNEFEREEGYRKQRCWFRVPLRFLISPA